MGSLIAWCGEEGWPLGGEERRRGNSLKSVLRSTLGNLDYTTSFFWFAPSPLWLQTNCYSCCSNREPPYLLIICLSWKYYVSAARFINPFAFFHHTCHISSLINSHVCECSSTLLHTTLMYWWAHPPTSSSSKFSLLSLAYCCCFLLSNLFIVFSFVFVFFKRVLGLRFELYLSWMNV
jgi:hypothetical protein